MKLNIFQWRSLKTRVTVFTLIIFLLSTWTMAFYASRMLRDDMQHLLGEQQFATVSVIAAEVNDRLSERLAALELIAKEVDADLMANPASLQARLEQRPLLQFMFNGGTWISRQDGIVISSNRPALIGANYADREYMLAVLKAGKSTISKPITGKVLKDPIIVMAVPIHDDQGQVIGALAGVTDLSQPSFFDKVTESRYGKTGGYLLIALQHQLFITATDKSRIMQPVPAPGINSMHDQYMQGFEGYGFSNSSRGVEELTAAKGIPVAGWFMVSVLPAAEAFTPIRAMQQRMLLATLFLTLLAGGVTWWMTLRMLKHQLSPMLAAARTLATSADSKQPPQRLPVTRQDEIGELLGGFNRLLEILAQREEALRDMAASLETKVDDRTRQLRTVTAQLALTEERERRLLAQDLHDNLGQLLALIKIKLTLLAAEVAPSSVSPLMALLDQAEQAVRIITLQLSPPILHMLGFVSALEWLSEEMRRIYGLTVHINNESGSKPLVDEVQSMLYRCVRELLINVAKHAKVSEASLSCRCDGSRLLLVVSDDGCGFDPANFRNALPGQGSFGLHSIVERITHLGGEMEIDSSPGQGTLISIIVPCSIAAKPAKEEQIS